MHHFFGGKESLCFVFSCIFVSDLLIRRLASDGAFVVIGTIVIFVCDGRNRESARRGGLIREPASRGGCNAIVMFACGGKNRESAGRGGLNRESANRGGRNLEFATRGGHNVKSAALAGTTSTL